MISVDIENKVVTIDGTEKLLDIIAIIESGEFGDKIEEWDIKSNIKNTSKVSHLDKCSKCLAFLLPSKDVPTYPIIIYRDNSNDNISGTTLDDFDSFIISNSLNVRF